MTFWKIGFTLLLGLVLSGCSRELAWQVSNRFKAIQLCLDDGGLKDVLDSKETSFTALCKDGRIVEYKASPQ